MYKDGHGEKKDAYHLGQDLVSENFGKFVEIVKS